jgi:hypothetical protein
LVSKTPATKTFQSNSIQKTIKLFRLFASSKGTWEQYKNETNNPLATRVSFKDSVDFIGWYTNKTEKLLKISKKDSFRQYIAYHEGWGNYKNYKKNAKVLPLAKKVEHQTNKYRKQLSECRKKLSRNKYIIF